MHIDAYHLGLFLRAGKRREKVDTQTILLTKLQANQACAESVLITA